ncbi:MAG: hypothetical protein SGI83_02270 [Bacteroidota bacterium]|nr:hypothetical protein [Bacteroidota bacterium]
MNLSFVKNEYLVKKFTIEQVYHKFEMELPTSVKRVQAISITHNYYDNPEITLGQVSLLSKDKNDIIVSASIKGNPLYYYVPNLYQKSSFQYSAFTGKHYIAQSHYLNACIGNTPNRNAGNNIIYKGDQILADLKHQIDENTNLPIVYLHPTKKNVLNGGRKPNLKDDASIGFQTGSIWIYGTQLYRCTNPALGNSQWENYALEEWDWFTIQTDTKPHEILFRKKPFAFQDKFTSVDVNNDSRFIDVVVHKTERLPNNPHLIGNGQPLKYNLWVYLVCERI